MLSHMSIKILSIVYKPFSKRADVTVSAEGKIRKVRYSWMARGKAPPREQWFDDIKSEVAYQITNEKLVSQGKKFPL